MTKYNVKQFQCEIAFAAINVNNSYSYVKQPCVGLQYSPWHCAIISQLCGSVVGHLTFVGLLLRNHFCKGCACLFFFILNQHLDTKHKIHESKADCVF